MSIHYTENGDQWRCYGSIDLDENGFPVDPEVDQAIGRYDIDGPTYPRQTRTFDDVAREFAETHQVSVQEAAQQIAGRELDALARRYAIDHDTDYVTALDRVMADPSNSDLVHYYAGPGGLA